MSWLVYSTTSLLPVPTQECGNEINMMWVWVWVCICVWVGGWVGVGCGGVVSNREGVCAGGMCTYENSVFVYVWE